MVRASRRPCRNDRSTSLSTSSSASRYDAAASPGRSEPAQQVGAGGRQVVRRGQRCPAPVRRARPAPPPGRPGTTGPRPGSAPRPATARRAAGRRRARRSAASRSPSHVGASACTRGDRGLQREPPGAPAVQRLEHQRRAPRAIAVAVPPAAVLVLEQHQPPVRVDPGGAPGVGEQQQRQQPADLALVRAAAARSIRARSTARSTRSRADQPVAGRRGVPGGEQQVHDGEHGVEPVGQLGAPAAPGRGCGRRVIFFFARVTRAAIVGSLTRKARATSAVVRPQTSRSVSADLRLAGQRRVAAGEDQPQPVVGDLVHRRRAARRRRGPARRTAPPAAAACRAAYRRGGAASSALRRAAVVSHAPGRARYAVARPGRAARPRTRPGRTPRPRSRSPATRTVAASTKAHSRRCASASDRGGPRRATSHAPDGPDRTCPGPAAPRRRRTPAGHSLAEREAWSRSRGLDQVEPAERLLGLDERAVGDDVRRGSSWRWRSAAARRRRGCCRRARRPARRTGRAPP